MEKRGEQDTNAITSATLERVGGTGVDAENVEEWMLRNPTSTLTKKQTVAQCSNKCKRKLSQLETDEVEISCGKGEPGWLRRDPLPPKHIYTH